VYTINGAAEGATSPLEKNLGAETLKKIAASVEAKPGDLVVAVSAKEQIPGTDASALLAGQLRLLLADQLKLIPKDRWEFLWITGFALFEWSATEKAVVSAQHPFTGIVEEDIPKLEDPSDEVRLSMRSKGYDLVLNGVELGSGSIRIHQQELQDRVFKMLGLSEEQRRARFGFFLDALTYGTPPHGGIALGLDRVTALLTGEKSIREVIAFPKTAKAQDLMADAPSTVDIDQLDQLGLLPNIKFEPCACGGGWIFVFEEYLIGGSSPAGVPCPDGGGPRALPISGSCSVFHFDKNRASFVPVNVV
jgi:aspartyl-tRNA synthetase